MSEYITSGNYPSFLLPQPANRKVNATDQELCKLAPIYIYIYISFKKSQKLSIVSFYIMFKVKNVTRSNLLY